MCATCNRFKFTGEEVREYHAKLGADLGLRPHSPLIECSYILTINCPDDIMVPIVNAYTTWGGDHRSYSSSNPEARHEFGASKVSSYNGGV